ncbi:hypothetical protein M422DRAFT_76311 [Sphaerobolus stellatus SS14]|uniref:GPI transamidase component PIG-T n=1 Tax=Sphaerobolus stellatus (strain SS14) TaxID=990650 RepID=A0A0C9TZ95_SPHS4|nr:hypothetical protein M422DRAFT_76311 [Sphaerobolus stellatus SS14]
MIRGWIGTGLWLLCLSQLALGGETFDEQLRIRPLQDGRLYTHFTFKTLLENASPRLPNMINTEDEPQHYTLFPLALGQIIREYAVTELHLSLNAGKWNYGSWGYPDDPNVGTGAELWVWMGEGEEGSFDARWQGLRNALAGLFCASLGELDDRRTTTPTVAFQPDGDLPKGTPHRLIYAFHPSENVCTENLTPFIKLLPCKSRSGIASLLNPHRLFDADWHGLSVRVLWKADQGVEVTLGVQAVFDPMRLKGESKRDWSFSRIFEKTINNACPVARQSDIILDLPASENYSISHPTDLLEPSMVYDVNTIDKPLDLSLSFEENHFTYPDTPLSETPLAIMRSQAGTSQTKGHLHVAFTNSLEEPQRVAYLEMPPWIIKPYLHTLTITVNDDPARRNDLIEHLTYIPTKDERPTLFEPILILPPQSTVHLSFDFDKTFLRYTQHPPDAHRGWDIPPAVLIPLSSNTSTIPTLPRMYSNNILVDLPTPDFSMPYNVIIMTCTLLAMFFGNIFNLLTREVVAINIVGSDYQ